MGCQEVILQMVMMMEMKKKTVKMAMLEDSEELYATSLKGVAPVKPTRSNSGPCLPQPQFRAWRLLVPDEVAAASGKGQLAFTWILEIEAQEATYELLSDSGAFVNLDVKPAAALSRMSSGELGRKITQAKEVEARRGLMLKGQQALWLVYQHYRIHADAGAFYDLFGILHTQLGPRLGWDGQRRRLFAVSIWRTFAAATS